MLTFGLAVFLLLATPGPGVLTTAGVGAAYGYQCGLSYVGGLFVGTNLVALAIISGLVAVLVAEPIIRNTLFWASAAYLLLLAYRIAFSGTKIAFIGAPKPPGFSGGLMLQAINPKAYVVNTTLFTGFSIWPSAIQAEILFKLAIINLIWLPVHILWLAAGVSLHRLQLSPQKQFLINVGMALAMLAVVGVSALHEL